MDAGGDRALHETNIGMIREVYDNEYPQRFQIELERALDARCCYIIIEPQELGDETARWISVGNCLHKSAVLSGLGSIASSIIWPENPFVYTPLGVFSLVCTGLYTASWQFDNCVKYQVETDHRKLTELSVFSAMSEISPIVLVRKDDTRRKILHWTVTLSAAVLCAYRLYKTMK